VSKNEDERKEEYLMYKDKKTTMVEVLVMAVFLILLNLIIPVKALAAYDCFICLDGIQGEPAYGRAPGVSPCGYPIDVTSWSFGDSQSASASGGGRATVSVKMQDFKFTKRVDKASPILFQDVASGKHIQRAIFVVRRAVTGGPAGTTAQAAASTQQVEYLKITLTDVLVSSFLNLGNSKSNEAYPIEEVTLNFKRIEIEYRPQKADGTLDTPVKAGWDMTRNMPSN
jgi:type VI secretion system secreted protein Hcp